MMMLFSKTVQKDLMNEERSQHLLTMRSALNFIKNLWKNTLNDNGNSYTTLQL